MHVFVLWSIAKMHIFMVWSIAKMHISTLKNVSKSLLQGHLKGLSSQKKRCFARRDVGIEIDILLTSIFERIGWISRVMRKDP